MLQIRVGRAYRAKNSPVYGSAKPEKGKAYQNLVYIGQSDCFRSQFLLEGWAEWPGSRGTDLRVKTMVSVGWFVLKDEPPQHF